MTVTYSDKKGVRPDVMNSLKWNVKAVMVSLAAGLLQAGCVVEQGAEGEVQEEAVDTAQDSLVNGAIVPDDRLLSGLLLWPGSAMQPSCTGTRVGPRQILTAAHCVVQQVVNLKSTWTASLASDYQPGWTFRYTNKHTAASAQASYFSGVIASTVLHPAWSLFCASSCSHDSLVANAIPDLALITLKADLDPQVGTAKIDLTPLAPGDTVTASGYGCEDSSLLQTEPRHFKSMAAKVISWAEANAGATVVQPVNAGLFASNFALTPGPSFGNASSLSYPGLCPGDSGAPLYRGYARPGQDYIVAVNSGRSADDAYISRVNYHARLENGVGVGSPTLVWLKAQVPANVFASMVGYSSTQSIQPLTVKWTYAGYPLAARHIAACEDGSVYSLNSDQSLYVNKSYGADNAWKYLDKPTSASLITCAGNTLYSFNRGVNNSVRQLYRFNPNAVGTKWTYIETMGQARTVAGNRSRLFAINDDKTLWSRLYLKSWQVMGTWAYGGTMAGGIDVDLVHGDIKSRLFVLANGNLSMSETNGTNGSWIVIDSPTYALEVAAAGPKVLYALNKDYRLYRGVINQ